MELFSKMIATALGVAVHQVNNTLSLLAGGATIPFISRYRKEATGGLDEVQIGEKTATINFANYPNAKKPFYLLLTHKAN